MGLLRPATLAAAGAVALTAVAASADVLRDRLRDVNTRDAGRDLIACAYIAKYDGPSVLSNRETARVCRDEQRLFFAATAREFGKLAEDGWVRYPAQRNRFFAAFEQQLNFRDEETR